MFSLFFKLIFEFMLFCGYISQGPTFPPSLSASEEKMYLEKMKNGDKNARNVLIERNMRLVAHIAKKYGTDATLDDLISIGSIGLIKGIDSYEAEKSKRLSSYISRCIENEVLMTLRAEKKRRNDISLDEPIGTDKDGNALTYSDIVPSDAQDIAEAMWTRIESNKLMNIIHKTLTPDEQEIIICRYGLCGKRPQTQLEISQRLGISRSYVSRIEKRCLQKMLRAFKNN